MKKLMLMILAVTVLGSGLVYGDYYNRNNAFENYAYTDYEYRLSNAEYHLNRYHGPVYYFHHYRANVYFVLAGNMVFVVPGYTFRNYINRPNFEWVSRSTFISMSGVGIGYYDSYYRFNYYYDYYNNYGWSVSYNNRLRRLFRPYYKDRYRHNNYVKNRARVMRDYELNRHKHHAPNYRRAGAPDRRYDNRRSYTHSKSRNYKPSIQKRQVRRNDRGNNHRSTYNRNSRNMSRSHARTSNNRGHSSHSKKYSKSSSSRDSGKRHR